MYLHPTYQQSNLSPSLSQIFPLSDIIQFLENGLAIIEKKRKVKNCILDLNQGCAVLIKIRIVALLVIAVNDND